MKKNIKIIILSIIILLSLLPEITGFQSRFGSSYAYIVKPMIWIFIGIISFVFFKNKVITNKKYKKEVDFYVFISILTYFLIYVILGYVKGFAHNPYDTSLMGIITNLWTYLPYILVKEYTRYFMINNCEKKKILLWTLLISLVFMVPDLNVGKFGEYFSSGSMVLEFVMQTLMPALIINLYLTYISYFSGFTTTILYLAIPQIVLYVIPILPNLDLLVLAILNSVVPFFSYIYINYCINKMDKTLERKSYKTVNKKGWFVMVALVIIMVCFGTGVFPIEPLVIASDSMKPVIHRGDIVIIKDIDPKKLKKDDIIRYRLDNYYVIHRIVSITVAKDGSLVFITKGDNNNDIDLYPVKESQVKGIIKTQIRYVGYPTLLINEMLKSGVGDTVKVDKGRVN